MADRRCRHRLGCMSVPVGSGSRHSSRTAGRSSSRLNKVMEACGPAGRWRAEWYPRCDRCGGRHRRCRRSGRWSCRWPARRTSVPV